MLSHVLQLAHVVVDFLMDHTKLHSPGLRQALLR
jgi:hypothetical protein